MQLRVYQYWLLNISWIFSPTGDKNFRHRTNIYTALLFLFYFSSSFDRARSRSTKNEFARVSCSILFSFPRYIYLFQVYFEQVWLLVESNISWKTTRNRKKKARGTKTNSVRLFVWNAKCMFFSVFLVPNGMCRCLVACKYCLKVRIHGIVFRMLFKLVRIPFSQYSLLKICLLCFLG